MSKYNQTQKKELLINVYNTSIMTPIIALAILNFLEICMIVYSFVKAEYFGDYLWYYRGMYISLFVLTAVTIIIFVYVKKDVDKRYRLMRVINPICSVLLFAWALGITFADLQMTGIMDSTVFMTISLVVSMCFFMLPLEYAVIVIAADSVMIFMAGMAAGSIGPVTNLTLFFIFQFILGILFIGLKINLAEHLIEERNRAERDIMTGFFNRLRYVEDLGKLESAPDQNNLVYVAVDVNGLKFVNDNMGHEAGDTFIKGAADCMKKCFGKYGSLYRTGGDEFIMMLFRRAGEH